ncbi:FAD-binding oxidoreductase [Homoserinimonas sp. OAct 916]|uniref:NAD(P)/FAD-dependent oxidoreductase n=1 Tax=Homoserinimonas sp. OAct 916 TaxID=2211450 RepID=UPI000DBE3795|nr:FAD-binding oxidoreductase [Homoserinimonas sp. OAct 916]
MKVVIIGAGVVGLSIAVNLARRGAEVTVIERNSAGSGTSSTSYAWVNANNKEPQSYFDLNLAGMRAHAEIAGSGAWLQQTGHVELATDDAHRFELEERTARLQQMGYPAEHISASRARELVPDLLIPDDCDSIVSFASESCCYPLPFVGHLLREAALEGVTILTGLNVERLEARGHGANVILEDGTVLAANHVVSAAGRWTNQITALAGVPPVMFEFTEPGDVTVGYLTITNPLPTSLTGLVTSPRLNVRPAGGGRLMLQALDLDVSADPTCVPDTSSVIATEFIDRLRGVLQNTAEAEIVELQVGQRAMPRDGLSVIGPAESAPWLYLVATHSGITLAPLLGSGVAGEIFGDSEPLFADFRPSRLAGDKVVNVPEAPRHPGEQ